MCAPSDFFGTASDWKNSKRNLSDPWGRRSNWRKNPWTDRWPPSATNRRKRSARVRRRRRRASCGAGHPRSQTTSSTSCTARLPPRAAACASPPSAGRGAQRRARRRPPAALPWLLLESSDCSKTKHLHCPEDGATVRIQLPSSQRLFGCHDGGWVVSSPPLRIANLFSVAKVPLPENQWGIFCKDKLVFSKPPTSADCILATITEFRGVALCRVGNPDSVWRTAKHRPGRRLEDITFCNGELYGLTRFEGDVYKFEIGVNDDGEPVVTAANLLNCPLWVENLTEKSYIFDLHGKIAVAMRSQCSLSQESFFKVFELVDIEGDGLATSCKHKWMEVTSLGDHALFFGRTFSMVVRVPDDDDRGGHLERNHIYYSRCSSKNDVVPDGSLFLTLQDDYGNRSYYRVDDGKKKNTGDDVKRIKSTGYLVDSHHYDSMWILPPDM
ncbi:hypothetical protein ZWY2020_019059 [Hordeum vulgare]|nr:hypothetical protein ZWY2020_019059 [Hordeum vulgare]